MPTDRRRAGQALVETAIALFTLVFAVLALLTFGRIIPDFQHYHALVRWRAGLRAQMPDATGDGIASDAIAACVDDVTTAPSVSLPSIPFTAQPEAETISWEVEEPPMRLSCRVLMPGLALPATAWRSNE